MIAQLFTDMDYGNVPREVARYFLMRGALWGIVATTLVALIVGKLKKKR